MPARFVLAGALSLLALTGCERPTPGVTLASGTQVVHMEATTFCRDGQSAEQRNCVEHLSRVGLVRVKQGDSVSVDVDSSLAEHGWILVDADAKARSAVQDDHHFSYTPDFQAGPVMHLEIRSLDHAADDARTTGVWKFQLVAS
ncbi:MAG TPA: hypothetical protein VMZ11_08035 [Mycobacteriales bacterium]|nr:hypothetical protein [Mycobacteriales bacterium]